MYKYDKHVCLQLLRYWIQSIKKIKGCHAELKPMQKNAIEAEHKACGNMDCKLHETGTERIAFANDPVTVMNVSK